MRKKTRRNIRATAVLLLFVCLLSVLPAGVSATGEQSTAPTLVNATAAYCVDTAQVLTSTRGDETFAPGVLTKLASLMTARDLLNDCDVPLDREITVKQAWVQGKYAVGDRSSPYLGLAEGETYSLEYLFATSLVANANDACACLVHYCAETLMSVSPAEAESEFLKRMNDNAKELGLEHTVFGDTIGYGGSGTTTVTDAVRLAAAFYRYNDLVELSNRESYGSIHNKNYLKSSFVVDGYLLEDAVGLIAGQATDAGNYCVLTACEKDGIAYVFAVMGAPGAQVDGGRTWFDPGNAYEDMMKMVPYVLGHYELKSICDTIEPIVELRTGEGAETDYLMLIPAEAVELMVPNGDDHPITKQITFDSEKIYESEFNGTNHPTIDPPVKQGDVLGSVSFLQDGEVIATVDLVARDSINTDAFKSVIAGLGDFLFDGAMGKLLRIVFAIIAVWILITIVVLIVRAVMWFRRREKEKRKRKPKNVNKS